MPDHVSFYLDSFEGQRRPTVTIYQDGDYKEHRPFAKAKKATIALFKYSSNSPNRKQLHLAERFASLALHINPSCVLEFGPSTSPWTYDFLSEQLGDDFVQALAGDGLKWGKKNSYSGPLRTRRQPKYKIRKKK